MALLRFADFEMGPAHTARATLFRLLPVALLATLTLALFGCAESSTPAANAVPVARIQRHSGALNSLMKKAKEAPPDKVLTMELEFANHDQAELDRLMAEVEDPHSKRYHQWLDPKEVHARFGESQDQFNAVLQWLQAQGLAVTDQNYGSNEDYIRFTGTVAQVDKAFQVHIMQPEFELYVPREDPFMPAQFSGVVARINGLDNVGFREVESR
ncbi:MAG TPA: protease pro-enzyme activation domain-containing protein [Candidatus Binataceae bacterium]|nr:protease pro-enzyme activation domain-containing protein [Candidatus Binataceae bacterium]